MNMPPPKAEPTATDSVLVPFPAARLAELEAFAQRSGRTVAAQLAHWVEVGMAVDTIAPAAAVPDGKPMDILHALAKCLEQPNLEKLRASLVSSTVPRYGTDPTDPKVVLEYRPDGRIVRGSFDDAGGFVPERADVS